MTRKNSNRRIQSRLELLTTVSAVALIASACGSESAFAGEPPLWVEIGIQSNRVYDSKNPVLPLGGLVPTADLPDAFFGGLSLKRSSDGYAKISFEPESTNWVFSAAITYGRAHHRGKRNASGARVSLPSSFVTYHTTIPTYRVPWHHTSFGQVGEKSNYVTGQTLRPESHFIVDFEAGRDVGIGLFGKSTISAGVRIVNFRSTEIARNVEGPQDVQFDKFEYTHPTVAFFTNSVQIVPWYFDSYNNNWRSLTAEGKSSGSFNGVGPSLHWDATTHLWGNKDHGGEIELDWGVNASLLFGRRKYSEQHHGTENYHCVGRLCGTQPPIMTSGSARADKNVTVPNVGGAIGVSYRFQNMKLSLGYHGDFFFHAMPTGNPTAATSNLGFQGPYASISVGIGD